MKSDRSAAMHDARRLDSEHKATLVLAAPDAALARAGRTPPSPASPATPGSAASSSTTIPTSEPRSSSKPTQATRRQANDMASATRVTGASLRAELENAEPRTAGSTTAPSCSKTASPSRRRPALGRRPPARTMLTELADRQLAQRNTELEQQLFDATRHLRRTTEELEAARAINRELMQRANRPAVHTAAPNMTTSAPNNSRRNRPGE